MSFCSLPGFSPVADNDARMWAEAFVRFIEDQAIIGAVGQRLQPQVSGLFKTAKSGQLVKNYLNGTWLGHPLHPVLTDVPIGAWTVALLFDLISMDAAADAAIALGISAAVASAITGIADWSDTYGRAQRIGVAHAALNITGTALYTASLIARRKSRPFGKFLSFLGYGVLNGGAFLGGELVYGQQIGVNHAAAQELPSDFIAVLPEAQLKKDTLTRVDAGGVAVLLVRRNDAIHALLETCSHLGGPLAEGTLEGGTVRCPWHGSSFCLETGGVVYGPATYSQPRFETRVRDGQIEVRATR